MQDKGHNKAVMNLRLAHDRVNATDSCRIDRSTAVIMLQQKLSLSAIHHAMLRAQNFAGDIEEIGKVQATLLRRLSGAGDVPTQTTRVQPAHRPASPLRQEGMVLTSVCSPAACSRAR